MRDAMAQYQADGVSEEYRAKEVRWSRAAGEVRSIISTLRGSLQSTDESASAALAAAGAAVEGMG